MKALLYLFSFYLLSLTFIPCDPMDNCCDEEIARNLPANLPANNKPEFPCSPFFTCGVSHGILIPELQIKIDQTFKLTTPITLFFSESPIAATLSSVWQPPKLA